jgi:hypothetical protein
MSAFVREKWNVLSLYGVINYFIPSMYDMIKLSVHRYGHLIALLPNGTEMKENFTIYSCHLEEKLKNQVKYYLCFWLLCYNTLKFLDWCLGASFFRPGQVRNALHAIAAKLIEHRALIHQECAIASLFFSQ